MFTGQIAVISNRATWRSDVVELYDEDGHVIDLSSPEYSVAIEVYIGAHHCHRKTGSLSDGKVVIVGPGFQWQFEDADLQGFCAGTYRCGVKLTINGYIDDLIVGDVAIVEGNS